MRLAWALLHRFSSPRSALRPRALFSSPASRAFFLLCFLLFLLSLPLATALSFSEVFFDPPGSDNNHEFVELAGVAGMNLSGFLFGDSASSDVLVLARWNASSPCALLVEDGFSFQNLSCSVYTLGSSLGNGLNNGGDDLFFFAPNGSLLLNQSYGGTAARGNGRSLHWNGSRVAWQAGAPSPCLCHSYYNNDNNSIFHNDSAGSGDDGGILTNSSNSSDSSSNSISDGSLNSSSDSSSNSSSESSSDSSSNSSSDGSSDSNADGSSPPVNGTTNGNFTNITNSSKNNENNSFSNSSSQGSSPNPPLTFTLSFLLPRQLFAHIPYRHPFWIVNANYTTGMNSTTVEFATRLCPRNESVRNETVSNETAPNSTVTNMSRTAMQCTTTRSTITIRSWRKVGMLLLNQTGNYTLCGRLTHTTQHQNASREWCWNLTATDPTKEVCHVNLTLNLTNPAPFYPAGEPIRFRNLLDAPGNFPYAIQYQVSTFDGQSLRTTITENQHEKQWTPPTTGEKVALYWLSNKLFFIACNNTSNRTSNQRLLVVVNEQGVEGNGSGDFDTSQLSLKLREKRYQTTTVPVTITIYRGKTKKYSVKLWAERKGRRASHPLTIYVKPYTTTVVTIPLVLTTITPGRYRVVAEGLDTRATAPFTLQATNASASQQARIASFYTRARKAQQSITLASLLEGAGAYTLQLFTLDNYTEERLLLHGKQRWQRKVKIRPGNNFYLLRLTGRGVYDQRVLFLVMNETAIATVPHFTTLPDFPALHAATPRAGKGILSSVNCTSANHTLQQSDASSKSGAPRFTGYAVKSTSRTATTLFPTFLGGALLLLLVRKR